MHSASMQPQTHTHTHRYGHTIERARVRRYWTLVEAEPRAWYVPNQALPSDARERADLVALARGDLKAAQARAFPAPILALRLMLTLR